MYVFESTIACCEAGVEDIVTTAADLPTHLQFSGDTRILQGSLAPPHRIVSHPGYTCYRFVFSQPLEMTLR